MNEKILSPSPESFKPLNIAGNEFKSLNDNGFFIPVKHNLSDPEMSVQKEFGYPNNLGSIRNESTQSKLNDQNQENIESTIAEAENFDNLFDLRSRVLSVKEHGEKIADIVKKGEGNVRYTNQSKKLERLLIEQYSDQYKDILSKPLRESIQRTAKKFIDKSDSEIDALKNPNNVVQPNNEPISDETSPSDNLTEPSTESATTQSESASPDNITEPFTAIELYQPISKELELAQNKLIDARKQYADITAKRRYIRTMFGFGSKKEQQTRQEYHEAIQKVSELTIEDFKKRQLNETLIKEMAIYGALKETEQLTTEIYNVRLSKNTNNNVLKSFYTWMGKLDNDKFLSLNNLKKSLTLFGIVLPVSVGVSLLTTGLAPLGGVVGVGVGAIIAKKSAGSIVAHKINKNVGIHKDQSEAQVNELNLIHTHLKNAENITPEDYTTITSKQTGQEVHKNRKKATLYIGTSLVAAAIGADIAKHLSNNHGAVVNHNTTPNKTIRSELTPQPQNTTSASTISKVALAPGEKYPWDYYANHYGAAKATPMIERLANVAKQKGWKINSFDRGINSMVSPTGQIYSSTEQIVEALQSFNN